MANGRPNGPLAHAGPALAALFLALVLSSSSHAQHWVERNTWRFDNFTTAELPWERYRDTFIGVPPERDPWSSAFDVVFYDHLYKTELSKEGNCYGMCLTALLLFKYEGHLGFCAPAYQYTESAVADPNAPLRLVINQMHGHQVNLPSLRLLLDIIATSKNRDGNYAYDQVNYYWSQDDPALVSITKSLSPADGGHTLIAYKAEPLGGQKRIFVYDPNRPWSTEAAYYQSNANVITIGGGGSWQFEMAGSPPEIWSGSPASGGNITIAPLSIAGPPSRLPSSLGLNALALISTIFVSSGQGSLVQVTDGAGKRMFKPGTIEIETDPSAGMLAAVPWFPSDGAPAGRELPAAYFFLRDPGPSVDVEVQGGERGYDIRFAGHQGLVRVKGAGGSGPDALRLERTVDGMPSLLLRNTSRSTEYEVELSDVVQRREQARSFRISRLRVPPGAPVAFELSPRDQALTVSSPDAEISYDLRMTAGSALGTTSADRPQLRIPPGGSQVFRPRSWRNLDAKDVEVQERPSTYRVRGK
jgi:hypothetical protein